MTQRDGTELVVEQSTLTSEQMINQSLRVCFHLLESKSAIVSQVIAATIGAGLIKTDEKGDGSRKFARYLPFWARVSFKCKPFAGPCSHDIYLIDKRLLI